MKGLLSNALYTQQYKLWKPQQQLSSSWEQQLQQVRVVLERLVKDRDPTPLLGATAGMILGSLVIVVFFILWYTWLQRNRRSFNNSKNNTKEGREYYNALSLMSRPTSDDSQYPQHRRQQQQQTQKQPSKPWWWTRLLRYAKRSMTAGNKFTVSGPACYLLYEPNESSGQLVKFYSQKPFNLEQPGGSGGGGGDDDGDGDKHDHHHHRSSTRIVVAVWKPASHISSHRYTQNAGRSVLIGNCTVGFQGRHNYCNGVCQFLKSAFANGGGAITFLSEEQQQQQQQQQQRGFAANAVLPPTDVYLYINDTRSQYQTQLLEPGKTRTIPSGTLAAACLPRNNSTTTNGGVTSSPAAPFYQNKVVDMYKWLADAERQGSSIRF